MDAVLHALSDRSRRTVLEVLRDRPATVSELADRLPIARPGVSRHLRVLREAGLVTERREGTRRLYRARREGLLSLREFLDGFWDERLDDLRLQAEHEERSRRG